MSSRPSFLDRIPTEVYGLGQRAILSCLFCATFHFVMQRFVRQRFSKIIKPKSQFDWANRCVATLHAALSGFICTMAMLSEEPAAANTKALLTLDHNTINNTDFFRGNSAAFGFVLPYTIGYFLYDLVAMLLDSEIYMDLMMVHHIFSLALWPVALLSGVGHYYVLQLLSTEATSPLLHASVFFLPKHGFKGKTLHTACGLLFLLAFTVWRILPIPLIAYSAYASWSGLSDISWPLFIAIFVGLPIPPLLNLYWYSLIVKGSLKALGLFDGKKKP